jgi:hypothetical protein
LQAVDTAPELLTGLDPDVLVGVVAVVVRACGSFPQRLPVLWQVLRHYPELAGRTESGGLPHERGCRRDGVLRERSSPRADCAAPQGAEHLIAGPQVGDSRAYRLHHAGHVAAPDLVRWSPQSGLQAKGVRHPCDGGPVRGVDARGPGRHRVDQHA